MPDPAPSLASQACQIISSPLRKLQSFLPRGPGHQLFRLEAEVGSPTTTAASNITRPTTERCPTAFPQFMNLPPQVRAMIWRYSIGCPRIFWINCHPHGDWNTSVALKFNHKPRPSTQVCCESRKITHSNGAFCFGLYAGILKSLWFDFSTDIIYLDNERMTDMRMHAHYDEFEKVENVAINWPASFIRRGDLEEVAEALMVFSSCKRLILVMEHMELPEGDVCFLRVEDDDKINLGVQFEDWGYAEWQVTWQLKRYRFPEGWKMPALEAVEVVPVRSL
ncbi:hypothetical protein FZEAL_10229 [Fusarium zealandicum]|uniref:2EXR domain-containing protein n=1 Tax=Fusarium zealandicum TaxID=1053134 RepID=A0A8H4U4G2_9HYPO|nr:hypothetical protein FZEAL_10229 [Fusarium zealandicum]